MADEAIQYMKQLKEIAPDKPFFVYYVPGGTHAPHHPTPEWIKKIGDTGSVDMRTWDYRRTVLRQDEMSRFIHSAKGTKYSDLLPLLGLGDLENVPIR